MIFEITPFAPDKHYGRVLNNHIIGFPDDAWIIIRDQDTLYLQNSYHIIEQAIVDHGDAALMTCMTNRVCDPKFIHSEHAFSLTDMVEHIDIARSQEKIGGYQEIDGIVPGYFWLFPKTTWIDNPFDDLPIMAEGATFDIRWTQKIMGKKILITSLYLFHLYRMGTHRWDTDHLR